MSDDQPSRNDFAEDRTILANERTYASWMRTSLATIAIGIAFERLYGSLQPLWLPRLIATSFLLLAVLIIVLAERRASSVLRNLNPHEIERAKPLYLRLFTTLIALAAIMLAVAIWAVD